jgi:hypothetical protein
MKKIISRQVPKMRIVPLATAGVLVSLTMGQAEAQGCVAGAQRWLQWEQYQQQQQQQQATRQQQQQQQQVTRQQRQPFTLPEGTTSPWQTVISGDQGCVTGALNAWRRPTRR